LGTPLKRFIIARCTPIPRGCSTLDRCCRASQEH